MITRYFKFASQEAFEATLPQGWRAVGESVAPLPAGVDALRVMPHPLCTPGRWGLDAQGFPVELVPPQPLSGYHVNALMNDAADLPPGWAECQVYPAAPMGIFAGSVAAPRPQEQKG